MFAQIEKSDNEHENGDVIINYIILEVEIKIYIIDSSLRGDSKLIIYIISCCRLILQPNIEIINVF